MGSDGRSIDLVNASGFAFQMAVEHAVRSSRGHNFRVIAREHPWRDPEGGEGGFVDLVLQAGAVTWAVECKRTRDATWVFLCDKSTSDPAPRVRCLWVGSAAGTARIAAWYDVNCKPLSPESMFCAVRGTGEGQQPLLERLAAIVVRATDAIADQDIGLSMAQKETTGAWGLYLPVIVTTAKLEVACLDVSTVVLADGTVPDAEFRAVPMVRFRKTFRTTPPPNATARNLEDASLEGERTVLIFNASSFVDLLRQSEIFKSDRRFDQWPWAEAAKDLGLP